MRISTIAFAIALSIGSAFAVDSVQVHVVTVGGNALAFSPDKVTAAVGDMVQFQFMPVNHSVVQSTFDQPCQPISDFTNNTGVFSGFMPVSASAAYIPTFTILINNTSPIWIYCSQAKHCQSGMAMVINENTAKNATRSLANYVAMAKGVSESESPWDGESGGSDSSIAASGTVAASGYVAPSGTVAASGSVVVSGGTTPTSTSTGAIVKSSNGAQALRAPEAMGLTALLAGAFALCL